MELLLPETKRRCEQGLGVGVDEEAKATGTPAALKPWACKCGLLNNGILPTGNVAGGLGNG